MVNDLCNNDGAQQTFEDAVFKATMKSASSGNPRYIHHRADGGTVAVAQPDGTLRKHTGKLL